MRGHRDEIGAGRPRVHLERSRRLHGVGVEERSRRMRRTRELRDILQRAENIVCPHDADEQRILADRAEERLRGDETLPVRGDDSDPKSRFAKLLRRGIHRRVLDRGD